MNQEKNFIKNRKGERIVVLLEKSGNQKGLSFVMHGLGGFKEQDHIATIARAFREKGFTVVRFDMTNTFGESDGKYENATLTNYYEDLEDVIEWAKTQPWFQKPFALSGHSLGGISIGLYAEKYPEYVSMLAPISPVVSGQLTLESHKEEDPEDFARWQKTGWTEEESQSKPGVIKRLPWSHMEDRVKYDLLPLASKLTMPVLLIVGEKDQTTPPHHIRKLFDVLPGPKEFRVIKNAYHTFRKKEELEELKKLFLRWIETHV